jgi:hypothetical protein
MTRAVGSLDGHGAIMDILCVFPSPPTAIKACAAIMDSNLVLALDSSYMSIIILGSGSQIQSNVGALKLKENRGAWLTRCRGRGSWCL